MIESVAIFGVIVGILTQDMMASLAFIAVSFISMFLARPLGASFDTVCRGVRRSN